MRKEVMLYIIAILLILSTIISFYVILKNDIEEEEDEEIKLSENIEDECTEEYNKIQEEIKQTSSSKPKVSVNAQLILKKYYKGCEHTINEYVEIPEEIVNMTKEEIEHQYSDWNIIGFEPEKITLYKEFEGECGQHFQMKIENGKIVIYVQNEEGTMELYEKTNISSATLSRISRCVKYGKGYNKMLKGK